MICARPTRQGDGEESALGKLWLHSCRNGARQWLEMLGGGPTLLASQEQDHPPVRSS